MRGVHMILETASSIYCGQQGGENYNCGLRDHFSGGSGSLLTVVLVVGVLLVSWILLTHSCYLDWCCPTSSVTFQSPCLLSFLTD